MAAPDTLQAAIGQRVERLPTSVRQVLACASALAAPTTAILTSLVENQGEVDDALSAAEEEGIVVLQGDAVAFCHPLLRSVAFAR
jgi:hypothetical protein